MEDGDEKSAKKEILTELESIKGLLNEGDADIPMLDDDMEDGDIPMLDPSEESDDDIPVLDPDDDEDEDDIPVLESDKPVTKEAADKSGMIVDEAALQDAIAQLESLELSPKSSKTRQEEESAEKELDGLFEVEDDFDEEASEEELAAEIAQIEKLAKIEAAHADPEARKKDVPTESAVAGSTLAAIQKLKERRLKKLTNKEGNDEADEQADATAETMERPAVSSDAGSSLMDKIRANAEAPLVPEANSESAKENPFLSNSSAAGKTTTGTSEAVPDPSPMPPESEEPPPPRRRGNVFLTDEEDEPDPASQAPSDAPIEFSGTPLPENKDKPTEEGELTDGSAEILSVIEQEIGETRLPSRPPDADQATVKSPAPLPGDIDAMIDEVIEEYMVVLETALRKKLKDKLSRK